MREGKYLENEATFLDSFNIGKTFIPFKTNFKCTDKKMSSGVSIKNNKLFLHLCTHILIIIFNKVLKYIFKVKSVLPIP